MSHRPSTSPTLESTCWSIQIVGNYSQPGFFSPLFTGAKGYLHYSRGIYIFHLVEVILWFCLDLFALGLLAGAPADCLGGGGGGGQGVCRSVGIFKLASQKQILTPSDMLLLTGLRPMCQPRASKHGYKSNGIIKEKFYTQGLLGLL